MGLLDKPKKTGGLLGGSPAPVSKDAMDFFAPSLSKGPSFSMSNSTQAVPDITTPDTARFIAEGVGYPLRSGIKAAQTIQEAVKPGSSFAINPQEDLGKYAAYFLGKDPIEPLQTTIPQGGGKFVDYVGQTGDIGVSLLPFIGSLEKGGIGALSKIIRGIDDAKSIETLLVKHGVEDTLAHDYSKIFAPMKDTKQIENGLLSLEKMQNTTKETGVIADQSGVNPEHVQKATADWEANYAPKAQELSDQISGLSNDLKAAKAADRPAIQESLDALHKEAGKLEDDFLGKYGAPEQKFDGVIPEWGTRNQYFNQNPYRDQLTEMAKTGNFDKEIIKEADRWDLEQVLKDKPAYLNDGNLSDKELLEFADKHNLYDTTTADGSVIVAKDKAAAERVIAAIEKKNGQRDLGLALGYEDTTATPIHEPMAPAVPGEADTRPIPQNLPEALPSEGQSAIPPSDESSLESVKQLPAEQSRPFAQAVGIGAKHTSQPTLFKRVMQKLDNGLTKVVEYVQDDKIRVKKLLEGKDMRVGDASNPYQKMTLYPGRVATRIEEAKAQIETMANDMVSLAHDSNRDVELVREDVNHYLQAAHAPERNLVLGDGAAGMKTAEAKSILERIDRTPGADEIKRIAKQARDLNYEGLMLLRDSGVISDDLYRTLTKRYPNHVPLQRIFEDEADVGGALSIRGFDVKSSGIKRAKGSDLEVNDIIGNIQHNYEQAVIRSEKNIVDQATLGFVRENRAALDGVMEVRKPKAVGKTFDDKLIMERTNDPTYLQMFENGQPVWIKVKDPALALALRGVNREKLPALLNTVGAFTRFYAGLATRFNPEFAFPNKIRDLQETMIYMAAQKDVGFKGAGKMFLKDPSSYKAVFDGIRGADTPGARLYQEMRELGGTTGGFGLSTRGQTSLDLEDVFATAQSKPRQAAENVVKYIDHWNTIFEDSTRLSVYKQALAQGASKDRAAALAKEASINFNRMGRGGPVINAIWMFSNASIQGSAKMIRSLKNPKVLAAVTATVGASVAAVNEWNDHIDPDWRNKVTKWDRLNGLPIMIPNDKGEGASYVVIPVSWGMKPIKVMADYAYDAASGHEVALKNAASDFFTSVADAYNPLGGTDLVSSFTPTVLDVPVEVVRNQSWSGSKIHPDFDKNAPRDIQYFDSLGQTATGKAFIEGTKELQKMTGIALSPADMAYAFDQYIGGAGKALEKTANSAIGVATGNPPPADEFPFVSRFYRTRTQQEVGQGASGDTEQLKGLLQNQSRENFYKNQGAEDQYTKMKAMSKEEANVAWKQLVKDDPETAKKVMQLASDEKKGLNYTERLVNQLGVKDGSRALYLKEKFDALKTPEDKGALWKDYVTKGIITRQVADQIEWLMKNPPKDKQANAGGSFTDMLATLTGAPKAYAHDKPIQNYYVRNNEVSHDDLEEAKAILFGEVSNRPPEKQALEAQTILNTAFNRMDEYRKRGITKTLTEVLRQPNQYQAYKGKEYNRYKTGALRPTDDQKLEAIDATISKVKNGSFQNNIGGYTFYSHKPDGRIVAINKPLFL